MKSVCVFCGGNPGKRPAYAIAARQLGEALAKGGLDLVYGGAHVGLMGVVADATLATGGKVYGVLPSFLAEKELAHLSLTDLRVVSSMHERKQAMSERADAFIAMPGGFGTMDELFEILTWAQLGLHQKPIALLNIEGYFDGLIHFIDHAVDERLLRPEHRDMLLVESDPLRIVPVLRSYKPPRVEKWLDRAQQT